MDSTNLVRLQCVRFLIEAAREVSADELDKIAMDLDAQKEVRLRLALAKSHLDAAVTSVEEAIRNAGREPWQNSDT